MKEEMKLKRPNVVTIFLWITGIVILVMAVYVVVTWQVRENPKVGRERFEL